MRAVVTGGAGFIGSHLVDLLLDKGHEVLVIDNFSTGRRDNLEHQRSNKNLRIIEADISQTNLTPYFKKDDRVFHLAALADIVPSIEQPEKYYRANVKGTFNLLECLKKVGGIKKLVYAASSSCYGIPDSFPTPESEIISPEYPYALTKRMGEELVLQWEKLYKIPSISLRLFNVYGTRSRTSGTYGAVFGVFLAQKLKNQPFTIVGDGKQTRDFTYVTDIANAFYEAARSDKSGEIYNVGSGKTVSINYLTELLGGRSTYIPKRPGEPECTFANISKITNELNWAPQVSVEQGVIEILKNIEYWKMAPVWTPESIEKETAKWFRAFS
ncbi:MAG: SDR family oxidoreductase [Halobacteriovoraceae bacterium]|jgi:UDP-glucose 4-epimerase|nr:SDR family oxidoreductase [Halobacteriovoraceae bacterium]MBT5094583.1 SDR family oxidoreductase [Halobacteriovoraceae bacterium]